MPSDAVNAKMAKQTEGRQLARKRQSTSVCYLFGWLVLLPAFQVQTLIWTSDSGSNPERAHGDKFLVCQLSKFATQQEM
jgi:hypothetical protein